MKLSRLTSPLSIELAAAPPTFLAVVAAGRFKDVGTFKGI
jgi:hypothetical protein